MPKEKNYNPVQEAKKAEKQKQIRKQKANLQAQRNEKLARRNPNRLQRDVDSLKALEHDGSIKPHERQRLQELEKEIAAVNKARAALGDKAPQFKTDKRFENDQAREKRTDGDKRRGPGGLLGKRTRDGQQKEDDSSNTDDDVGDIPMPRDTPPPIPWQQQQHRSVSHAGEVAHAEPRKPTLVYEAAPEKRNLFKEATKFMPTSVAQKVKLAKGEGRLLEPEEFDELQREGYLKKAGMRRISDEGTIADKEQEELEEFLKKNDTSIQQDAQMAVEMAVAEAEYNMMIDEAKGEIRGIQDEAAVAEKQLRAVEMEEVEDEEFRTY